MSKAIYLKTTEEKCICMIPIQDGTECEINIIENNTEVVQVVGYFKGRFGCIVFYRAKNFILVGEVDEKQFEREYNKELV